ncbi:hypothetical protein [Agromyces silvae]|uniref:hypothetical protein n=1 Tax=Agromyces silvae TaxID=3388266 RepID=UPI00280A7A60|nr:hypothetical protein [Agromyces protaetiae]
MSHQNPTGNAQGGTGEAGPDDNAATSLPADIDQPSIEETDEQYGSDGDSQAAADHAGGVGAPVGVASEGRARATEADDDASR